MLRKNLLSLLSMVVIFVMVLAVAPAVHGQTSLPSYQLTFLGAGSPWSALPSPSGAMSTFPTDVNDSGVIVGVSYDTQWNPVAVRWNPGGNGYTVETLPRLPGDASSYATGINNLGQIVGARRALGYTPTGSGWLYSDAQGLVDLAAVYGLWTVPGGINDSGLIISGVERLDLTTGVRQDLGAGPSNYNAVSMVAINNNGLMAGSASLRSTSLNIVSVFRYEGASGWRFIAGSSRYTTASSINNLGDIGYGELGAWAACSIQRRRRRAGLSPAVGL
jgi:uncharacterized membrane protein